MNANPIENLFAEHFTALSSDIDQLLQEQGYDQLLVYSGGLKIQYCDDIPYPFRINPYFKMLAPGLANPNCWVLWRVGEKPILLNYQPDDFWHAAPDLLPKFLGQHYDIAELKCPDDAKQHIQDVKSGAFLGEIDDTITDWNLGERNPAKLMAALNWRRSYKSEFEQACIQNANQISQKGHLAAKHAFYDGASELDISLAFQRGCQHDEYRLAYPSVVGINEHAGVLHYAKRETTEFAPADRRSLLIDAGAEYLGYASDITRTYSFHDDEFGQMIQALDTGQQKLAQSMRPGDNYASVNTNAKLLCGSVLREFGVIDMTPVSAMETGLIDSFFPHGVGHFLGLNVHDVAGNYSGPSGDTLPDLPQDKKFRLLRSVETGHVFTIEPGIYFIPLLLEPLAQSKLKAAVNWQKVEQFLPYGGVRIEDNIVMTDTGALNLTRQAFADES